MLTQENLFKTEDQHEKYEKSSDGSNKAEDGLVENQTSNADEAEKKSEQNQDQDSEEEDDGQFDHLVPKNWEQIADMRLRMLDKEYNQCLNYNMKSDMTPLQGLDNVLGVQRSQKDQIAQRLQEISQQDLKDA